MATKRSNGAMPNAYYFSLRYSPPFVGSHIERPSQLILGVLDASRSNLCSAHSCRDPQQKRYTANRVVADDKSFTFYKQEHGPRANPAGACREISGSEKADDFLRQSVSRLESALFRGRPFSSSNEQPQNRLCDRYFGRVIPKRTFTPCVLFILPSYFFSLPVLLPR